MRRNFSKMLLTLSFVTFMISGCAKDQVKPDEGIAAGNAVTAEQKAAEQQAAQLAAQQAAEQAAAQKQAQQLAEQQAAARQAAAQQSALRAEQLKDQQTQEDAAATLARPGQQATTSTAVQQGDSSAAAKSANGLSRIHFDFDSYALKQPARDTLYSNAEYLLKKSHAKVRLEGHCDERGSDEYNLALGENRAKAALNYLITLGVPADQLSIVSYGKERPLDNGHNEEAWSKNRRVEFEFVK